MSGVSLDMNAPRDALWLAEWLDHHGYTTPHEQAAAELRRLHDVEKQYHELLYAVGNKYEDESRHQTALRYIQQAEAHDSAAIAKAEGQA